jgi:hypothetical protein
MNRLKVTILKLMTVEAVGREAIWAGFGIVFLFAVLLFLRPFIH